MAKRRNENKVYNCSMRQGITKTPKFAEKGLAPFAINIGTKCNNDCLYCSSGAMLRMHPSFKKCGQDPFGFGYAIIDKDKPAKVARDAKTIKKGGLVELCTVTDAWCPAARKYSLGRRCLDAALNEPDWTVRILTKNHQVEDDFDLIKKYRDMVLVGLSITATPDKSDVMKVIEKNASPINERVRVLKKAHKMGLRTYMMLCPLLPSMGDSPEQIDQYICLAEEIEAEEIFCEAVNPRGKGLILVQGELEKYGYENEASAVGAIRHKAGWSKYSVALIKNVQRSVREYSDIGKLRLLLYPKNLLPEDRQEIEKDDEGIKWL